jgi:hypothetical protein
MPQRQVASHSHGSQDRQLLDFDAMPKFFFSIRDRTTDPDEERLEFPGISAAREAAVQATGDITAKQVTSGEQDGHV